MYRVLINGIHADNKSHGRPETTSNQWSRDSLFDTWEQAVIHIRNWYDYDGPLLMEPNVPMKPFRSDPYTTVEIRTEE